MYQQNVNVTSGSNNSGSKNRSQPRTMKRETKIGKITNFRTVSPGFEMVNKVNNKQVSNNLNSNYISKTTTDSNSRFKNTGNSLNVKMSSGRVENITVKRSTLFSKINELDEILKK